MPRYQSFFSKTEVVFGTGMLDRLSAYSGQKVGIVTDAFMVKSGALARVRAHLKGSECLVYDEAIPEPPIETVSKGAGLLADFEPDAIVALGGGSAIDAAKAILAVVREVKPQLTIQFVAIPTTSGTGSEVTSYAVISDPSRNRKFPLVSNSLIPDVAILDPEFVRTAPANVTVDTGMDVITHAIEALASTGSSYCSDALAAKALTLAFESLPVAFSNGDDLKARAEMHQASCMAGMAFNSSGLGLNHGMAHAIGGQFHVAHGRLNAMLLPVVIEYNAGLTEDSVFCEETADVYAKAATSLGLRFPSLKMGVWALIHAIERLNAGFGIPATLRGQGIDMHAFTRSEQTLVKAIFSDACTATNPRKPVAQDLVRLLRRVGG
ncbi:1-propanol dehydrogenase PduQ [uncultured Cohaesibacter sp.]|uniref:1-propanol dehydrogenase PduQ n=1 Tax=uncultured Cohaesibacter sp. TaxID=1002546 RepID=UPI0029C81F53|nr:1-propanol dehydrogenase PduQ [uncultured Cohaesibacter sp.]